MPIVGLLQAQSPPGWFSFLPFVLIVFVMWFLILRPHQKQQARHRQMVGALKVGDKIVTTGGLYGTIVQLGERTLKVRIADNVKVEVARSAVSGNQGGSDDTGEAR